MRQLELFPVFFLAISRKITLRKSMEEDQIEFQCRHLFSNSEIYMLPSPLIRIHVQDWFSCKQIKRAVPSCLLYICCVVTAHCISVSDSLNHLRKIASHYINMHQTELQTFYCYSPSEKMHSNSLAYNKKNALCFLFFPWPFPVSFAVFDYGYRH